MITIPAADAAAHGLPAIGMQLDAENQLIVSPFPDGDMYLIASGPPGGRLLFQVWKTDEAGRDAAAVRRAVEKRFTVPSLAPTTWGPDGTLQLAGAQRPAVAYLSDKGFMQTGWCATLVAHAAGTLLVVFASGAPGATSISCEKVVSHPSLAPVVRSFQIIEG